VKRKTGRGRASDSREISDIRHFYKPQALRALARVSAGILAVDEQAEGQFAGMQMKDVAP
jgi:hypothetical protein